MDLNTHTHTHCRRGEVTVRRFGASLVATCLLVVGLPLSRVIASAVPPGD